MLVEVLLALLEFGLEIVLGGHFLESHGQMFHLGLIFGVIHGKPTNSGLRAKHGLQFHVLGDQMVARHFVDLFATEQNAERVALRMLQDLHVANSAFLPLFDLRIEPEHLGAVLEEHFLVFFPCGDLDELGQRNDGLKMRIVIVVASISFASVPTIIGFARRRFAENGRALTGEFEVLAVLGAKAEPALFASGGFGHVRK